MSLVVMKEAIPPDFSINIASSFCKESGSDSLGLYFFLVLQEKSVFVGAVAEFDCFDLVVSRVWLYGTDNTSFILTVVSYTSCREPDTLSGNMY